MAKDKPFNNPFGTLKLASKEPPKPAPAAKAAPPPRPRAASGRSASEEDDAALFFESVGGVEEVRRGAPTVGTTRPPPPARLKEEEDESLLRLTELVATSTHFEVASGDAFIEGAVEGLDEKVLRKLHRGDWKVQGELDLHGLTQAQAKPQLEVFLRASRMKGLRCVRLIHGRGLHSPDQIAVLKQGVQRWLTAGLLAKQVLAFCTAKPEDGGTGAVYVLLRK